MKKVMIAAFALFALFGVSGKAHADVNYPWCIVGDTRAVDCYFSSREQCMQDGRNRGFGGQCIQNPAYKPGQPPTVSGPVAKRTVLQAARPAVSAAYSTCTGMKSACLSYGWSRYSFGTDAGPEYNDQFCNFYWEHCMKTGWWRGRRPEPR
jgi:hypothetical protein